MARHDIPTGRPTGRPKEVDVSPPEIQAIRKAFVEQFMRWGTFDNVMHQKLLAYAITQRPPEDA